MSALELEAGAGAQIRKRNGARALPLDTRLPDDLLQLRSGSAGSRLSAHDRNAVHETVLLAEWATDSRRWELLKECLTEDVKLDHPMGRARNRAEYVRLLSTGGFLDGLRHLIWNLVAWGNEDGTATALHYVGLATFAQTGAATPPPDLPRLAGLGLAELTLVKEADGHWRIRAFHNDQYVMNDDYLTDPSERRRWALTLDRCSDGRDA